MHQEIQRGLQQKSHHWYPESISYPSGPLAVRPFSLLFRIQAKRLRGHTSDGSSLSQLSVQNKVVYRYPHYISNHGNWAEPQKALTEAWTLDRESSPRFVRLRFSKTEPLHPQSPSKGFKIKPSNLFQVTNWPCNQIMSTICLFSSPPKKLWRILSLALMAQGGR